VGYIIGPRVAGTIFAGGVFSWLLMMPAIKFFGSKLPAALYPSTIPIAQMTSEQLWASYIRPMGAGAVAAAGLITLLKTLPTIIESFRAGLKDLAAGAQAAKTKSRVEDDLSMKIVLIGSGLLVLVIIALLTFYPVPGAPTGLGANILAGILVVIFGFLFVTVSSRIVGLIGSSANPISGMTIATLMATCALFLAAGWTAGSYAVLALTIGGLVHRLGQRRGHLAGLEDRLPGGATWKQQTALIIGVMAAVSVIGLTLILMNRGLAEYKPITIAVTSTSFPGRADSVARVSARRQELLPAERHRLDTVPDGKYSIRPKPSKSKSSGSRASAASRRRRRRRG
jgi:putative OPT family oligopeptide transporter